MRFLQISLVLCTLTSAFAHWDSAYFRTEHDGFKSRPNWMSGIRDDAKLSEVALPGTHDSGTYNVHSEIATTQCISFDQQLNYGIRVFDIRVRHINNVFALHHGIMFLNLRFDDFLRSANNFLNNYPSETILFRLKKEHTDENNSRSLRETLESYLAPYNGKNYLKTTDKGLQLKQARGKFIILSNDSEFDNHGLKYGSFDIQDRYNLNSNWDLYGKWESVKAHLYTAVKGSKDQFYLNYLSGSGGSFPYFVASGHMSSGTSASRLSTGRTTPAFKNSWPDFPRLNCFIGICTIAFEGTNILTRDAISKMNKNRDGTRNVGIILADFPGDSLINDIIDNNWRIRK